MEGTVVISKTLYVEHNKALSDKYQKIHNKTEDSLDNALEPLILSEYSGYTFYRTFGGGPEGGYITGENSSGEEEVLTVKRSWGTEFSVAPAPAMDPQSLRLESKKTKDGLVFVRIVGEWEQVYDEPEDFGQYTNDIKKCANCGKDLEENKEEGIYCDMCEYDENEASEPSFSPEELLRK